MLHTLLSRPSQTTLAKYANLDSTFVATLLGQLSVDQGICSLQYLDGFLNATEERLERTICPDLQPGLRTCLVEASINCANSARRLQGESRALVTFKVIVEVICPDGTCDNLGALSESIFEQADARVQNALQDGSFVATLLSLGMLPEEVIDIISKSAFSSEFTQATISSGSSEVAGEWCHGKYEDGKKYVFGEVVSYGSNTFVVEDNGGQVTKIIPTSETHNFKCTSVTCDSSPDGSAAWTKMEQRCFVSHCACVSTFDTNPSH